MISRSIQNFKLGSLHRTKVTASSGLAMGPRKVHALPGQPVEPGSLDLPVSVTAQLRPKVIDGDE